MSDNQVDYEALNKTQRYTQWVTFRAIPGALATDREDIIAQASAFFADLDGAGEVTVRGIYDVTGTRSDADVMIWWHAEHFEQLQKALADFRRTPPWARCLSWGGSATGCTAPRSSTARTCPRS